MAARVERSVVKPPNENLFKGNDRRANGYLPLTETRGAMPPDPNLSRFMHGDTGGSANLARRPSEVGPLPNHTTFVDGDKGLSADHPVPFPDMPGRGAVPVNPFFASGGIAQASPSPDDATSALTRMGK
jgi:hypothetical protein